MSCLMTQENDNFETLPPRSRSHQKKQRKNTNNFTENFTDYHNKSTYNYAQVDLVAASFMEQLKYTKYLKMTQLTNIQYGKLF